jgi:general secretion pathway protein D
MSDTHTRILQNPQVRVTDGGTAKLRIGSRFPYATGSFLPSFTGTVGGGGTAGTNPGLGLLASTQFQYQDVGVNLDLSPHLLANGEVALHAKIEISSVGNAVSIGGLEEPSFGQRNIEHDIRLKEGEVNLLGGLIESTRTQGVSGLPGLSQIPGLRYLFSTEHATRSDTEVLVMLTPRVIRLPELASERDKYVPLGSDTKAPALGSGPFPESAPQMPPQLPGPPGPPGVPPPRQPPQ